MFISKWRDEEKKNGNKWKFFAIQTSLTFNYLSLSIHFTCLLILYLVVCVHFIGSWKKKPNGKWIRYVLNGTEIYFGLLFSIKRNGIR